MIFNNGSEVCIVFMEVKVPVATFTIVNEDGTKRDPETTEVFWLKTKNGSDGTNSFHDINNDGNWVQLSCTKGTKDGAYTTWLFGYQVALGGTNERVGNVLNPSEEELAKLKCTDALFDKVQIKNYLEGTLNGSYSIVVNSYGIQASYLTDANGDYLFGGDGSLAANAKVEETLLQQIWNLYGSRMA